MKLFLLNDIEN
jgi:hypothetical protein